MTHLWSYRGKGQKGIPAIDSKLHYLNHFDLYADIRALYRSKIYRQTSATPDVAGAEIAIWNDRYVADEATNASQNNLYPIMMAMAERAWRGGGTEYFDSLGTNMDRPGTDDFKEFADFERRMLHHKATSLRHIAIPYVKQTNVHWRITDAFPNGGDLSQPVSARNRRTSTELHLCRLCLQHTPRHKRRHISEARMGSSHHTRILC